MKRPFVAAVEKKRVVNKPGIINSLKISHRVIDPPKTSYLSIYILKKNERSSFVRIAAVNKDLSTSDLR
jgi:hypothetical protein